MLQYLYQSLPSVDASTTAVPQRVAIGLSGLSMEDGMTALSIDIGQSWGLTWPHWKRLVAVVEELGFAGLYCSDHFVGGPDPATASLEPLVSLSYLASQTQRVHFGPLVAPVSFRDPVMLARQALALDDLSSGRMVLGLGTGHGESEHTMFGYNLGNMPTRFARLGEALEVVTRLLRSDEPTSFEGRFYQLHDAILLPRPQRAGGPPIMVGGSGPKRTLPLVARYADIWNARLPPNVFRERSAQLDELIRGAGRRPRTCDERWHSGRSAGAMRPSSSGV
jgi:alkanesulfonate monooxygenase SsuD/methylene tetrahydromethanopterin reductase-like flavin-dependent oxidoreductase (luciferase family)